MHQRWEQLLFLHWDCDPATIQRTLPEGLEVDCWSGRAYLGVVPFFMSGVRPRGLPSVPWLSDFLELNVRTYVRDRHGRRGVWFYSLDCNQPIAVRIARMVFNLPYFDAAMNARRMGDRIEYFSRRAQADFRLTYEPTGPAAPSEVGSLEEFLVERYRLFALRGKTLLTGCVWHEPYQIAEVKIEGDPSAPAKMAGFDTGSDPPVHSTFSHGVEVRIFPMTRA